MPPPGQPSEQKCPELGAGAGAGAGEGRGDCCPDPPDKARRHHGLRQDGLCSLAYLSPGPNHTPRNPLSF